MLLDKLLMPRTEAPQNHTGLVLMGGGARTAYQAGVLRGIGQLLRTHKQLSHAANTFPFKVLVGTSAGALNATFLASQAASGLDAFENLAAFWLKLRSHHVYELDAPTWARHNLLTAGWVLARQVRAHSALLDNTPLVDTLHKAIKLQAIEGAISQGLIASLAVTTSSYTSGMHWTFVQTKDEATPDPWRRADRRADMQPITIEHLMASSAIPFIFRSVPLWVDGHREFFGDGSMRQSAPLSPAIHLGAKRILAIGVGRPVGQTERIHAAQGEPTAGVIASHAMAGIFHDTLHTDAEQARRVSQAVLELSPKLRQALPYRPLHVLAIHPSESLDQVALRHAHLLPKSTRSVLLGLGALNDHMGRSNDNAAGLASYLMFEPGFIHSLMALGEHDARAHSRALLEFFAMP